MTIAAALVPGADVDRRTVATLTAGHLGADLFLGTIPALIPFFVAAKGLSYADAGLLVLAGSLASSIAQPLAGLAGDRVRAPWLAPFGLVLAALGLLVATSAGGFAATGLALLVGGLGVAIFHPEALRATRAAAGESPGTALGVFAVGGNLGFALGPALAVPLGAAFGLQAVGAVAFVPLAAAVVMLWGSRPAHLDTAAPALATSTRHDPRAFLAAAAAATFLAACLFGLMAFVPVWFSQEASLQLGSTAVAAMLVAGAFGTYLGGRVSDARGRGPLIVGSLAALVPLVAIVPLAPPLAAFVVVVAAGFAVEMSYYPLLAVAQDALPRRAGFAAGVVLGLSIGIGAACVSLLGRLADAYGPSAALWACAGFAALALTVAGVLRSE